MVAVASEKTFRSFVLAAGHPEWITDPRYEKYADRRDHWDELMTGIETWSRTLNSRQCLDALNRFGVPCSAYRSVAEAMADPQTTHRQALTEVADGGGAFRVLNLPFRMSGADTTPGGWVPALGEHSAAILKQAGYSDDEIAKLTGT
jgi:crotonobetainyl-CoA:carnitine CoA-transferase CaiB-like acyl-CoA transferase